MKVLNKILKNNIATLILLSILSVVIAGCGQTNKDLLIGKWQGEMAVTDIVLKNAYGWLDTEDTDVSDYFGKYSIKTYIIFEDNGTYRCSIDVDSYQKTLEQAESSFKQAFIAIAKASIEQAGKTGDEVSIEKAMKDSIDMSLDEYLEMYGPELLPSYEKMCEVYEITGQYGLVEDGLMISENIDTAYENGETFIYSCDADVLSFGNNGDMSSYTRVKEEDN